LSRAQNERRGDIEALAKGGRTSILGFIIRLIARIPFLFVASQWYGATQAGRLALAVAVVEFAAQISTLGLKRGLALHLTGDGKENGAWDAVLIVLVATLIPTLVLMLFPALMFPNSAINGLDYLMPLVIPAVAISDITLAALAYRMNIGATVRARAVVEPWTISIAAFALWPILPRDGLLVAYALSMGTALVASVIPFLNSYGLPRNWTPRAIELYYLMKRNMPLAAADAIEWGSRRLDVLILGAFVSPATVGIYWVAQQIASLPQKLKTSFDPVLGPVITRKLEEGDTSAVARQISQVGFWIMATQAGVALALAIPGESLMEAIGPNRDFVGGTGALVLLLFAEVVASAAVVSEAALVYIARHRNLMISLVVIAAQVVLSVTFILGLQWLGYNEFFQAAAPALGLALSLGLGSIAKTKLAAKVLDAPVPIWRWSFLIALAVGTCVGGAVIQMPTWFELSIGIFAILGSYWMVIWRYGFSEEDRMLFRKGAT
jgi:O-antigen/teichoic acid export membrane protein